MRFYIAIIIIGKKSDSLKLLSFCFVVFPSLSSIFLFIILLYSAPCHYAFFCRSMVLSFDFCFVAFAKCHIKKDDKWMSCTVWIWHSEKLKHSMIPSFWGKKTKCRSNSSYSFHPRNAALEHLTGQNICW